MVLLLMRKFMTKLSNGSYVMAKLSIILVLVSLIFSLFSIYVDIYSLPLAQFSLFLALLTLNGYTIRHPNAGVLTTLSFATALLELLIFLCFCLVLFSLLVTQPSFKMGLLFFFMALQSPFLSYHNFFLW